MNTTANLGKAPIRSLVLQLAIPSMTAQFVNVLYSIIDRMYIGHISENGALVLAGAGVCGPIVTLLTSFGTLVGIGGSITMGIRMGEKNTKKALSLLKDASNHNLLEAKIELLTYYTQNYFQNKDENTLTKINQLLTEIENHKQYNKNIKEKIENIIINIKQKEKVNRKLFQE